MKKLVLLFICPLLIFSSLLSCNLANKVKNSISPEIQADFVPNLPDVPLMKGFTVDETSSSFFDSAEGRIVEVSANGTAKGNEISSFYDRTMPQFGWVKTGKLAYKKEGESLLITPIASGQSTTLKFQLKPAK